METKKNEISIFSENISAKCSSVLRNKSTRISRIFERVFVSIVAKDMNCAERVTGSVFCDFQAVKPPNRGLHIIGDFYPGRK